MNADDIVNPSCMPFTHSMPYAITSLTYCFTYNAFYSSKEKSQNTNNKWCMQEKKTNKLFGGSTQIMICRYHWAHGVLWYNDHLYAFPLKSLTRMHNDVCGVLVWEWEWERERERKSCNVERSEYGTKQITKKKNLVNGCQLKLQADTENISLSLSPAPSLSSLYYL